MFHTLLHSLRVSRAHNLHSRLFQAQLFQIGILSCTVFAASFGFPSDSVAQTAPQVVAPLTPIKPGLPSTQHKKPATKTIPADADSALLPLTPPPHLAASSAEAEPAPYPEASLAPVQVQEAFYTAAKPHRRVMLVFGANWCPDCRILGGIFSLPEAALWLEKNFVVVPVNVERLNANMSLAKKYGVDITAIPTVLLLTPQGHLLNPGTAESLGHARAMSPQAVLDLIADWARH